MRVFVTGASGFVGRRLLPRLEAHGHRVKGVDREVDITDPAALEGALRREKPDAVVHLAAMSSVARSWREPERCYALNWGGTRNLLRATAQACPAARVLLIGSADAYGTTEPRDQPFDEATPLAPRSPYARTKVAAELLGEIAAEQGRDIVRVRAFNHTGKGQADQFVVSSFARQVAAIRRGDQEPVMRVGNLESIRDFLHVDDVIDAYAHLLDPSVPADVYNVASARPVRIQEVLDRLIAMAEITPTVERDPERFRATDWSVGSAERLRQATGWRPQVALEAILRELYEDWLENDPTKRRSSH